LQKIGVRNAGLPFPNEHHPGVPDVGIRVLPLALAVRLPIDHELIGAQLAMATKADSVREKLLLSAKNWSKPGIAQT
jgi:hypothetical protein